MEADGPPSVPEAPRHSEGVEPGLDYLSWLPESFAQAMPKTTPLKKLTSGTVQVGAGLRAQSSAFSLRPGHQQEGRAAWKSLQEKDPFEVPWGGGDTDSGLFGASSLLGFSSRCSGRGKEVASQSCRHCI